MNPARGVKFPQQAAREAPAIIAGDDFAKLLNEVDEPYRTAAIEQLERQLFPTVPKSQEPDSEPASVKAEDMATTEAPAAASERRPTFALRATADNLRLSLK